MTLRRTLILGAVVCGIVATGGAPAGAAFVEIADFNNLVLGPIAGQNGWYAADPTSVVALDPDGAGLNVLSVVTESTILYHEAVVPEGTTRLLFTRFRYEDQLSVSFGLTQNLSPDRFGEFDVELSLTSTRDDLRINDDGTYLVAATLESEHWYNCWILVDNAADVTSIWLHDRGFEAATAADQLSIEGRTVFPFRGTVLGDLRNFFIKTGGGDGLSGPLLLDDIFMQDTDAVDLSHPAASVAGVGLPPAVMNLVGAWPNPFNPQTTISYTLAESQPVSLAVHDLSGRLVRRLFSGVREPGAYATKWDGRDNRGAAVASGVYLARLIGREEAWTAKLMLVR